MKALLLRQFVIATTLLLGVFPAKAQVKADWVSTSSGKLLLTPSSKGSDITIEGRFVYHTDLASCSVLMVCRPGGSNGPQIFIIQENGAGSSWFRIVEQPINAVPFVSATFGNGGSSPQIEMTDKGIGFYFPPLSIQSKQVPYAAYTYVAGKLDKQEMQ